MVNNMIKLNPIRREVKNIEGELYLPLPRDIAEMLDMPEGTLVKYLPEKVNPRETISDITGSLKLKIPIVDPKDIRGFSESPGSSEEVKEAVLQQLRDMGLDVKRIGRGRISIYDIGSGCRIYLKYSMHLEPAAPYFYGLDPNVIQEFNKDISKQFFIVFIAGNKNNVYIFPWKDFEEWLTGVSPADQDNNFKISFTSGLKLRLTGKNPIDISKYLNNFELLDCNSNTHSAPK